MSKFWNFVRVKNEADGTENVELRISGDIVDDGLAWLYDWFGEPCASPNAFREELRDYQGQDITVWIDSYGGDVFAAAGIYNALKEHKGKITTKVDGKAMSAGSVIFMAGEERFVSPLGIVMIHNPITGVKGDERVMRKTADVLSVVKETIMNAYMVSGKTREEISQMMDDETYMSANVAVREGFADGVLYSDGPVLIENIKDFAFNRFAIVNSTNETIKKMMELEKRLKNKPLSPGVIDKLVPKNINKEGEDVEIKNVAELENAYPQLVSEIKNAAKEEGISEERQRLKTIDEISNTVDDALVVKAKYDEPISAEQLAISALKADARKSTEYLGNVTKDVTESKVNNVNGVPSAHKDQADVKAEEDAAVNNIVAGANQRRGN